MDKTSLFGIFEISFAVIYFFIAGLCVAKRNHIKAFTGLIYYSLSMGIFDLCQGLYYIYQKLNFSPIMIAIIFTCLPFTYLTCFIVCYQYGFPNKSTKFIKYLFIIPIITIFLSLTYNYHDLYLSFGNEYTLSAFKEIKVYSGYWEHVIEIYDFLVCMATITCLVFTIRKFSRMKRTPIFVCILIIFTLVLDITTVFSDSVFIYYFELAMRLLSVTFMYITLNSDVNENIIFQGQIKLIESLPFPIFFEDKRFHIVYANCEALTICPDIGDYYDINNSSSKFFNIFNIYNTTPKNNLSSNDITKNETIMINKNTGDLYFLRTTKIYSRRNKVIGKMYMFIALDSMHNLINNLRTMALKDKLCDFYNRNFLEPKKHLYETDKDSLPLTLIMCDINNLKYVNDNFGHDYGDEYILFCCKIIKTCLRAFDIVIRLGGDEFLIILPNTSLYEGEKIANKISSKENFSKVEKLDEKIIKKLGIASGVATTTSIPFDFDKLLKIADNNMYKNKVMQKAE